MRALFFLILLAFPLISFGQATPVVVADICPGGCSSNPSNLVEWNGKVYFFATSPTAGRELHVYDGTSVSVVADIAAGISNGTTGRLSLLNNRLYFAANDTASATRSYLYQYDGTNAPQKVLLTGNQQISTNGEHSPAGNELVFGHTDSAGRFRVAKYSSGSNSIQIFGTPGGSDTYISFGPYDFLGTSGYAYFKGYQYLGPVRHRLIDLNSGATVSVTDPPLSSTAKLLGDNIYFLHNASPGGFQLFRFNLPSLSGGPISQTNSSTINSANHETVGIHNNSVFYVGYVPPSTAPQHLYRYDPSTGTANQLGTLPTRTPYPKNFSFAKSIGNVLYLGYESDATGVELYGYNGGAGIIPITDVDGPTAGFNPTAILSYNGDLLIAGTTSANGTELYRITGTGLGLTDAQAKSAAILSPNPATSQLTIALPSSSRYHYHLRILSATGQTLRTQDLEGPSASINIEDLPAGLYFALITNALTGAPVSRARFIKE